MDRRGRLARRGFGLPWRAVGTFLLLASVSGALALAPPTQEAQGRPGGNDPPQPLTGLRSGTPVKPGAGGSVRARRLRPADDGQQLLIRDVFVNPAYISPGTSPRSQDSTAISYLVVSRDTITVAIYLDEVVGDSLTGNFDVLQDASTIRVSRPTPYLRIFSGFVNDIRVPDGTYLVTVRAANDTNRVEEVRRPLEIDTVPPRLLAPIVEANGQSVFRNGDTIVLTARLDRPDYRVTADFSALDSDLDPTLTTVFDAGDGRYTVHHLLSSANTRADGQARRVRLTFRDKAGNNLVDTSLLFCLRNAPPRLVSARYLPGGAAIYKDGGTIRIETVWASNAGPLTVFADFRNIDSRFDSTRVAVTERAGNLFELAYEIDADNERPDRSDYRVKVSARDSGCGTTVDTSLTVALDNQRGEAPTLTAPPTATRGAIVSVSGRAAGNDYVVIRRATTVLDTAEVAADARFTASVPLVPGENALTAEAYDHAGNKSSPLNFSIFRVSEAFVTLPARYEPSTPIRVAPARRADRLRLELWTLSGNLVRVIEDSRPADLFDLNWDGRNGQGTRVNSGPLLALIRIDYPDGGSETLKQAFILVAP